MPSRSVHSASVQPSRCWTSSATRLWLEDGLARNTLESYRRDLQPVRALAAADADGRSLLEAAHADLLAYLAHRFQRQGASRAPRARLLSSLKRFYQFAVRQGKLAADPTLNIDAPKRPRGAAQEPDRSRRRAAAGCARRGDAAGAARRAMLELLYAAGLRVSELVSLKLAQLSQDMGVVRILGKGSKERLVPVGEEALRLGAALRQRSAAAAARGRPSDALFVTARAQP